MSTEAFLPRSVALLAEQRQRRGPRDTDLDKLPRQRRRPIENDDIVGRCAAHQLRVVRAVRRVDMGLLAQPFDQHRDGLSQEGFAQVSTDLLLNGQQFAIAPLLDLIGHGIGVSLVRGRPGTLRVLKDEAISIASPAYQRDRGLEILLGLARESDDEIPRDRAIPGILQNPRVGSCTAAVVC